MVFQRLYKPMNIKFLLLVQMKDCREVDTIIVKSVRVPIFAMEHISLQTMHEVLKCKKFTEYINKIQKSSDSVYLSRIQILNVFYFGSKVGFINLKAITSINNTPLPEYVFMRGAAVCILILINQTKMLTLQQYRVPLQKTCIEIPAGMLDQSGDFVGTAAAQIYQETSIKINKQQLSYLGKYYSSPQTSDEELLMFYVKLNLSEQEIARIQEKIHGVHESQRIKVKIMDYNPEVILKSQASAFLALAYAYQSRQV